MLTLIWVLCYNVEFLLFWYHWYSVFNRALGTVLYDGFPDVCTVPPPLTEGFCCICIYLLYLHCFSVCGLSVPYALYPVHLNGEDYTSSRLLFELLYMSHQPRVTLQLIALLHCIVYISWLCSLWRLLPWRRSFDRKLGSIKNGNLHGI